MDLIETDIPSVCEDVGHTIMRPHQCKVGHKMSNSSRFYTCRRINSRCIQNFVWTDYAKCGFDISSAKSYEERV